MVKFWLSTLATGNMLSCSMDNCVFLPFEGYQKRRQSGLLHRIVPVCYSDSTIGKHTNQQFCDENCCNCPLIENRFWNCKIRGATLTGASHGVWFYVQPNWSTLLEASVWGDAASQIFYSFGLACNSLVSFASYSHVSWFGHVSFNRGAQGRLFLFRVSSI